MRIKGIVNFLILAIAGHFVYLSIHAQTQTNKFQNQNINYWEAADQIKRMQNEQLIKQSQRNNPVSRRDCMFIENGDADRIRLLRSRMFAAISFFYKYANPSGSIRANQK